MSALGEYVHLKKMNYLEYGTHRYGEREKYVPYQNFLVNRTKNIKPINIKTINELKRRLKGDTLSRIAEDKRKAKSNQQDRIDIVYDLLSKGATEDLFFKMNDTSALKSSHFQKIYDPSLTKEKILKNRQIIDNINELIQQINEKGNQFKGSEADLKKLSNYYAELTQSKPISVEEMSSSIGIIQEEINQYIWNTGYTNLLGAFGEYYTATCDDAVMNLSQEALTKAIMSKVIGDEKSTISITDQSPYFQQSKSMSDSVGNSYSTVSSQNKVDVKIIVNEEEINASVKNYQNIGNIHLQSETSLFHALKYLNNYHNFSNHWLNVHAYHAGGRGVSADSLKGIDKTVEQELKYEGLVVGNPSKSNSDKLAANTFIAIDRSTGNVFVKNVGDLLNNKILRDRIKITPSIQDIHFSNRKEETIEKRLQTLLAEVHAQKLAVSIALTKPMMY